MYHKKEICPYIILLIVIVFGYWQVSFLAGGLKWDLIDVVLPFRYYFSECIRSGYFPFWNPYQQTGTPFFADLQAPVYYPELLVTSLLGGYGVYTMHLLFIFYLFIAAAGMYKLSFSFNASRNASLIAGIAYSFSGYIVGHGQHFFLLVGAAWIPWVLISYIKHNKENKTIDTLQSGIFLFLMFTGAYQALSITISYLLLLIFLYFLISSILKRDMKKTLRIIKSNLLLFLIVCILCLPLIISTLEILTSVDRLEAGVNLKNSLHFSQPFTTLISFLLPFTTIKNLSFFGNIDSSLINHYFGVILLVFFLVSLSKKHTITEYIILGFGIIIFMMSFDFLPIRSFMFKHIPFMNLFVSAAYLSIFGTLGFILFSVNYFAYFEKNYAQEKFKIIILSSLLLLPLLVLAGISVTRISSEDFKLISEANGIIDFLRKMSFFQNMLLQATVHTLILTAVIIVVAYHKKFRYPVKIIILLAVAEIVLASQLNMDATVADTDFKPAEMRRDLSLCPDNFPIPVDGKIIFNDQQHAFFAPFWRNTYIFTKQISFDAFSSFNLKSYSKLNSEYLNLKKAVLNNHLFYFSDSIISLKQFADSAIDDVNSAGYLYLAHNDYLLLTGKDAETDTSDILQIQEFTPNRVTVKTDTKHDQFLTMLQTNYKGWKAYIDDTPVPVYTSNFNYRTICLPKGSHLVKYEYKNNKVFISYIISNVLFFVCISFLLGYRLYQVNFKNRTWIIIPLAAPALLLGLTLLNFSHKSETYTTSQYYNARYKEENAYFILKPEFMFDKKNVDTVIVYSGNKSIVVHPETEFLPVAELVQENNKIKKGILKVTAQIYITDYCKALIVSDINNEWHAAKIEKQIERLNHWNEIRYLINIPALNENVVVKVYIWNPDKSKFIIDNISVEMYSR